jgi:hypothetical protein
MGVTEFWSMIIPVHRNSGIKKMGCTSSLVQPIKFVCDKMESTCGEAIPSEQVDSI